MAQNIYDDGGFFAAYAQLDRSVHGLDGAPEWPSVRALVPPLGRCDVVDLGCGYGWFCRWAADQGAASVLGIDLSERMLARAAADGDAGGRITYRRADLDELTLPAGSFDVAHSALTIHYLDDLDRFLRTVHGALRPGGTLVCSTEHPIWSAPTSPAFVTLPDGRAVWPLDRYLEEGPRVTDWLSPGIVKQHRTVGTIVTALAHASFRVTDLVEWGPSAEQVAARPEWAGERDRPPFLLVAATAQPT